MKIISTYLAGVKTRFIIYERVEEFKASGHKLIKLAVAKKDDYVLTDNGYYVPVIDRNVYHNKKNGRDVLKITVPRHKFMFTYDSVNKKITSRYHFLFSFEPKKEEFKQLSLRVKGFAIAISKGFDLFAAYKIVYGNGRAANMKLQRRILSILKLPGFYKYLRSLGYMQELNNTLEEAGLTPKFFAESIKALMLDKDESLSLRKWAYEIAYELLNKSSSVGTNALPAAQPEAVDRLMKKAIPENLARNQ